MSRLYRCIKWLGHFIRNGVFVESAGSPLYFKHMAQVNVSLPDDLSEWARSQAAQGSFADASDYVRDVVRRDREHGERLARLQAAIDEGRASSISRRTIDDVIADGRRRHAGR